MKGMSPSPSPLPLGEGGKVYDDLTPTEKIYLPYAQLQEQIRQAHRDLLSVWAFEKLEEIRAIQKQIQELEAKQKKVIESLHRHIAGKMKKRMV